MVLSNVEMLAASDEDSDNSEIKEEVEDVDNGHHKEETLEADDEIGSSDDDDDDNDNGEEEEDDDTKESKIFHNPGWADAMAKILKTNKPKRKKSLVLSRAMKVRKVTEVVEEKLPFEIDGEVKEEKPKPPVVTKAEMMLSRRQLAEAKRKKQLLKLIGRRKPSVLDRNREKALSKMATKGVVQLFNAVRRQQKAIEGAKKEVRSEVKKEKLIKSVNKQTFLDLFMSKENSSVPEVKTEDEDEDEKPASKTWSVLRDDFMMSTKLKDWDKGENVDDEPLD